MTQGPIFLAENAKTEAGDAGRQKAAKDASAVLDNSLNLPHLPRCPVGGQPQFSGLTLDLRVHLFGIVL